ncbi:hypothetical protein N3K63_04710 [Microbacterium sp. W1N]|uniref:hypothetical protein n=1 Tax=Microbacterium festucae TaxID=2977531 RepID=UPI0021C0CD98|nr:hypothetical protein [Microbacterium festucae]MCT9819585.1 hypothetical protein [Microbacterium festucae]
MNAFPTVHAEPRFESDATTYRVNFWDRERPDHAWLLDAYVLVGATSVAEVMEWAHQNAAERTFEVFVELEADPVGDFTVPRRSVLVRLHGRNPNL